MKAVGDAVAERKMTEVRHGWRGGVWHVRGTMLPRNPGLIL